MSRRFVVFVGQPQQKDRASRCWVHPRRGPNLSNFNSSNRDVFHGTGVISVAFELYGPRTGDHFGITNSAVLEKNIVHPSKSSRTDAPVSAHDAQVAHRNIACWSHSVCIVRTLDRNPVVSHIDVTRIHKDVLARVGIQSIRVANFSGGQHRKVGHSNVLGQKGMDEPHGGIPGRESIQDNVGGVVKLDQFGPEHGFEYRFVVCIEVSAIVLRYRH
mmetsp:Transcript_17002/g.35525  ORF Transcript_17002/g.35525 Transcript_17002/m.35525 type:complete len:216 (-) Transcript_17002:663-1310(-)